MFCIFHSFAFFIEPYNEMTDSIQLSSCHDNIKPYFWDKQLICLCVSQRHNTVDLSCPQNKLVSGSF